MIELKTCPCCGSSAVGFNFRRAGRSAGDLYRVLCINCGMSTSLMDTPEEAAAAWCDRKTNSDVVSSDPESLIQWRRKKPVYAVNTEAKANKALTSKWG